jgi:hypothetical protein
VQVLALEDATLLGALAEVLGLTRLLAFIDLEAVAATTEEGKEVQIKEGEME